MYPASEAFREAVYSRNPKERILITMPGLCLNAEDLTSSLSFAEAVNNEEELTIGECPSATLEFNIFNGHGLLSDYPFVSECTAMIGVRTEQAEGVASAPYAILRYGLDNPLVIAGSAQRPYITVNGVAPSTQPPFPVHAIVIDGSRIYCVSEKGEAWGAAWIDGETWNAAARLTWDEISAEQWADLHGYLVPLGAALDWDSLAEKTWAELDDGITVWGEFFDTLDTIPFMQMKLAKWAAQKRGVWRNGFISYEFGEAIEKYEYVPLGKFLPDQPKKRRVTQIAFTASDRMMLFERDSTEFLDSLAYPITIGEVLARLCAYIGVTLATPTFINSTRELAEPLFASEAVTCREVLGWIAEAAGAYARMTRDGELELAWFGAEPVEIPMEQYFDIDIAEYQVAPIDKLQILGSDTDIGVIIGEGTNGYQIMDNPYLYGASDAEIRPLGVPIYNRLAAFAAFSPIKARAVCDWAIQAGDVISIALNGVNYRLPIYRQTVTWNGGGARVSYESTGAASRPVMSAANRRVFNQKRAIHELEVTVDGFASRIEDVEGGVLDLEATAQGLALEVSKKVGDDEIIASINASAEEVAIQAEKIKFEGAVTANNYFKINTDGSMEAVNGKFTGTLNATGGSIGGFTIQSNRLQGSSLSLYSSYGNGYIQLGSTTLQGYGSGIIGLYCPDWIMSGLRVTAPTVQGDVVYVGNYSYTPNNYIPNCRIDIDNGMLYRTSNSNSSIRYKADVRDCDESWRGIYELRPVIHKYKDDATGRELYGLIAEDVAQVMPMLVEYVTDNHGNKYPDNVDYSRLTAPILMALQDINERLTRLEEKLNGAE